jgi:integrase
VGWKLLSENPCKHIELPAWDRKEAKYLTEEQTLALLAAARKDKWYVAFLIAIETGARPNEYLALRWSDLDFDGCSLAIRRSLYWPPGLGRKKPGDGAFEFTKPKTQRSNRTITISAPAIETLRQHRREQLEERMRKGPADYQDNGLIFATEEGTPLLWRNLASRHLKPLLKAAEIPHEGISLYTLRHTAASLLIASGEHIRVIAERLGTSTTMIDITYSHVPQKLQQTATDHLARMLHGT